MSGRDMESRTESRSAIPADPTLYAAASTGSSPAGGPLLSTTMSTLQTDKGPEDLKSTDDTPRRSGEQSSGGGSRSGSKQKVSSAETSTTKLDVFQRRIWMFQLIAILLVLGLCIAQLVTASSFFSESENIAAHITMDLLKESYDIQHVAVSTIVEQREIYLSFLNGSKYSKEEIEYILRTEADPLNLEFVTVVNDQGVIVASALDQRIGQGFDPNFIVSRVIDSYSTGNSDDALQYIIEIGELTKAEFANFESPYHLTCDADGYNQKNTFKFQEKALMIYACGAIVDEKGVLKGAKVTGYMLNGKHRISRTALVSSGTDAFTGIIQKTENGWNVSQFLLSRGLSESFVYAIFDDHELYDKAYESDSLVIQEGELESEKQDYSVVVEPLPKSEYKKRKSNFTELGESTPGLFVAGKGNSKVDLSLAATQIGTIAFLCATIIAIFIYTTVATRLFLGPLRLLVAAVEKKDQSKITKTIDDMRKLKKSICTVAFGILAINSLLAGMLSYNFERITSTYQDQSSALPLFRINEIFYRQKTLEHVIDSRGFALNPDLISLFQTNGTEYQKDLDSSEAAMKEWMDEHRIQLFFIVNSSMHVIASATEMPSSITEFDPNGIVTEALGYGSGIRASVLLDNSLYTSLHPKYFTESNLRAVQTGKSAAVQLVVTPIFLSISSTTPVGAIVVAAELNGNPDDLTVRGADYLEEGCIGFFIQENGIPVMISSACSLKDGSKVGASLETEVVKNMVLEVARTGVYSRSLQTEVLDQDFEVIVDQVYPGSEYDHDGHEHLSRTYDNSIFMVQCSSLSRWKYLIKTIVSISSVTFFFNLFASIVLAYVTFKPIYEFGLRYERKWEAKSMHQTGGKIALTNIVPRIVRKKPEVMVIDASSVANTIPD